MPTVPPRIPPDAERIEPYEIVRIRTGARVTPPYMDVWIYGLRAVLQEGLKKDGTPSMGTMAGRLSVYDPATERRRSSPQLHDYVRYDAAQEAIAQPIRDELTRLLLAVEDAERRLLAVYQEPTDA
jgi:hypothetical protein